MLLRFEEGILELCAVALLPKLRAMSPEERSAFDTCTCVCVCVCAYVCTCMFVY